MVIAALAGGQQAVALADRLAGFEVLEACLDLALEGLETRDLRACLVELLRVDLAHFPHRRRCGRSRAVLLDLLHDGLDVGEAEPEILELLDPADPDERLRTVKAVTALRAAGRLEQIHLLVEVDGADRLPRLAREITHLQVRERMRRRGYDGQRIEEGESNV